MSMSNSWIRNYHLALRGIRSRFFIDVFRALQSVVVYMYHCSEYPLYRHQHFVTVYLNKYKVPSAKLLRPAEIWIRLRAQLMGSASVSIFPWPECRHIQGMHIQLLSRSRCYQPKYNCENILRYIHDGRCQSLQAAQPQIASCKSFSIWQFLNKDLPMAIITNDNF